MDEVTEEEIAKTNRRYEKMKLEAEKIDREYEKKMEEQFKREYDEIHRSPLLAIHIP